tara:strand:+ start:16919 stop:17212 length:294 start_codon:yes stop_codon:yes gene_type:complete
MSFEKDALMHEIQDQVDNFYRDNIVIPIYWREQNGRKIYDLEYMQSEFDKHMEKLWDINSKEDCYACATQRHACEHDNWEDYQCGNDEAPRKEEGEF